jgi:hypothetical protein
MTLLWRWLTRSGYHLTRDELDDLTFMEVGLMLGLDQRTDPTDADLEQILADMGSWRPPSDERKG